MAYEVAVLRWSIAGSPYLGSSKSRPPDFHKYVGYLDEGHNNPSEEEEELTREEFAKLSEEEKQEHRKKKSEKHRQMWAVALEKKAGG